MIDFEFNPTLLPIGSMMPCVPTDVISEEPMLYSASLEFARNFGGPLTARALECMEPMFKYKPLPPGCHWVIDTRSHMLVQGLYPAIGGWHCDAVPRAHYNAQPDLSRMNPDVWHGVVHVSTHPEGVSSTEFAGVNATLEINSNRVWASAHEAFQERLGDQQQHKDRVITPGDGKVVMFNMPTLHRATPATRRGWRWWMRASMYYARPINKIRRHVQVYVPSEGMGW